MNGRIVTRLRREAKAETVSQVAAVFEKKKKEYLRKKRQLGEPKFKTSKRQERLKAYREKYFK